jgi:hypothetical protein
MRADSYHWSVLRCGVSSVGTRLCYHDAQGLGARESDGRVVYQETRDSLVRASLRRTRVDCEPRMRVLGSNGFFVGVFGLY